MGCFVGVDSIGRCCFLFEITPPKTNSLPPKIGLPKRKLVFQPSIFTCELLVSGSVVGKKHAHPKLDLFHRPSKYIIRCFSLEPLETLEIQPFPQRLGCLLRVYIAGQPSATLTYPLRNKGLTRPYEGKPMVNRP